MGWSPQFLAEEVSRQRKDTETQSEVQQRGVWVFSGGRRVGISIWFRIGQVNAFCSGAAEVSCGMFGQSKLEKKGSETAKLSVHGVTKLGVAG